MLLAVRVPAGNDRGPLYVDQALAAIHAANPAYLTLGFARQKGHVILTVDCPDMLRSVVESQLYAAYPDVKLEHLPPLLTNNETTWQMPLQLHRYLFPIKRYPQFEDALNRVTADPLTAILNTLAVEKRQQLRPAIEITVRPASARRRRRPEKILRKLAAPFFRRHPRIAHIYLDLALSTSRALRLVGWLLGRLGRPEQSHSHLDPLHTSGTLRHDREEDVQAAADKLGRLLFEAHVHLTVTGPADAENQAKAKLREMAGAFGQFSQTRLASFRMGRIRRWRSWIPHRRPRGFLLSTEELATLWHPPTQTVRAETMAIVESREFEPPVQLPLPSSSPEVCALGLATFRGRTTRFGILPDDRRRHVALLGKTGMGKSTLLLQLARSDIRSGRGIGLIDPHGDLAEAVLATVPRHRTNDVILFDAGDHEHPVSFNMLACPRPEERALRASAILSAFKKLYAESWGPRMEHVLRNSLLALLETPDSTLVSLLRLLTDNRFRHSIAARLGDPVVRAFWQEEFARLPLKLQIEAVAPIQNKVGHFVSNPLLRNIVGQARSSIDLRHVMDNGKILVVNLSKGRIGEDASVLLGSFLVSAIQLAAMSRADQPEEARRDFYFSVDEFQNFATESFAAILSEARKYRLNLTIANQYLAQMDEPTLHAVFGNIGTMICFQVGAKDAEVLAEQFGGDLTEQDLLRLPRYQAYCRLLINGHPSFPFSMETLPAGPQRNSGRATIIRRASRQRYARPAERVNREIAAAISARG